MSRLKQSQSIDSLIKNLQIVAENQCSLSEQDQGNLDEAISRLHELKRKKGKTNEQLLKEVANIVELIAKFFK